MGAPVPTFPPKSGADAEGGLRPAIQLDPTLVPATLRGRPQWVGWKLEERDGKPTKVPVDPRTGYNASPTDPATWSSFEQAVAAWERNEAYAGVGYVFAADDPYAGIDLDGCIDDGGVVAPAAREIIDSFSSYTEVSPGGRGVKIFIEGRKPEGVGCKSKAISGFKETEVYDRARFFTVTGRHLAGTPGTVEERQPQLDTLCSKLWPPKKSSEAKRVIAPLPRSGSGTVDDDLLIEKAGRAKNGAKFRALFFEGDTSGHGGDDSAADIALCEILAYWTGKAPDQMDRLFRRSALLRPKWNEKRGDRTYGEMTVQRAIELCSKVYTRVPTKAAPTPEPPSGMDAEPAQPAEGLIPLGERDPNTGRLVLSPKRTLPTAEAYVREFHHHADGRTLCTYGGLPMEWRGNRYVEVEEEFIKQRLQPWLHRALCYVLNKQTRDLELADFESNPNTVRHAWETVRSYVHVPASVNPPAWLDGGIDRPPAVEVLPCRSVNVHIPTGLVFPATPALFTVNSLDFDYDPDPEPPEQWTKFLEQLFGDDLESVRLLQEWMGYSLTGDTSLQKMLLLVGPRRSGKGTIGRVLTRLVGAGNVAGPTTSSLAGAFGLQPLIGKSLAIVSDARFSGEHVATVIERLLCISGEDTLSIDRKFLGAVTMKLPTRFVFFTNELPRLSDASTALAGRFLVLRLSRSFYGCEDPTLTNRLVAELPGILHWAIEGWKRLHARGRFVQPKSAEDAIMDMEDLASPVSAFVRERCVVGPGHRVHLDDLYAAWKTWCEQDGRTVVSHKQTFGRDLTAAISGVKRRRGTAQASFYEGISLRSAIPL